MTPTSGAEPLEVSGPPTDSREAQPQSARNFKKAPLCSFLTVVFLYNAVSITSSDLSMSFFRSLIGCELPLPREVEGVWECPYGASLIVDNATNVKSCVANDRFHPEWSLSAKCADAEKVYVRAYIVMASIMAIASVGNMITGSLIGVMFTDFWGRKPVIVIAFVSMLIEGVAWTYASSTGGSMDDSSTSFWVWFGIMASAFLNSFAQACSAMAVDGTDPDSSQRTTNLVLVTIANAVGVASVQIFGYFVLQERLEGYFSIWLGYTLGVVVCIGIAMFILVETKPDNFDIASLTPGERLKVALNEVYLALIVILSDRKLFVGVLATSISAGLAVVAQSQGSTWSRGALDMLPETSSIGSSIGPVFQTLGAIISAFGANGLGQLQCVYIGTVMMAVGIGLVPLGYYIPEWGTAFWWVGQVGLLSLSFGFVASPAAGLMSSRVPDEDQGKFFSAFGFVVSTMVAAGLFLNSTYLIGEDEAVYLMTLSYSICSCGIFLTLPIWYAFWGCADNTKVAEGGHAPGDEDPTTARNLSSLGLLKARSTSFMVDEALKSHGGSVQV